ncbi:MAG TPA: hypothetical protein VFG14_11365 [Chthoniobacteraceae bacterium]|jgi:hypothetical protein|nr:hypothetical protein [Chthoniobacteraceae bacterium]
MSNLSAPFYELATALRERLAVIADRELYTRDPAAHLEQLKQASERIESASAQLPRPVNGELAHFLKGCSYQKALSWLEQNPR